MKEKKSLSRFERGRNARSEVRTVKWKERNNTATRQGYKFKTKEKGCLQKFGRPLKGSSRALCSAIAGPGRGKKKSGHFSRVI